jgi:1,2-diacylglycerol 3-alpha-glucosyltransferase
MTKNDESNSVQNEVLEHSLRDVDLGDENPYSSIIPKDKIVFETSKIRLGIITNTYHPDRNGISRAVSALEKELKTVGIEVFLVVPRAKGVYYPDNILALDGANLPKSISDDLKLLTYSKKEIVKFFRSKKVKILHTHDTMFGGIEGSDIAKTLKIPCVHTFHTMIEYYDHTPFIYYREVVRRCIIAVCNSYDAVITPSRKSEEYLKSLKIKTNLYRIFNVLYLKNQSSEIPNSIMEKYEYLKDNSKFTFITFCRLDSAKSLDLTIEYMEPILKSNPNSRLIIAGGGPELTELTDLAVDLGIADKVIFTGSYDPQELNAIVRISNSKVFIFTSLSDNLPTNIVEAMNYGLPVVSIDPAATDYIVRDGENGYFFRNKKEFVPICQKMIDQPELLEVLSCNALESYKEFQSGDYTGDHIQLYSFLLDRQDTITKQLENLPANIFTKRIKTKVKTLQSKFKEGMEEILGNITESVDHNYLTKGKK